MSSLQSPAVDSGHPLYDYSNEPDAPKGQINMGAYGNTEVASWGPLPKGTLFLLK